MAKRCPLMFVAEKGVGVFGSSAGECIGERCMWFVGDDCAVSVIAKGFPKVME